MIDDATRVKEQKPLLVMILGFSKDKVHVILARHVANYRWHWQHSVEADLKILRSPEVDERLIWLNSPNLSHVQSTQ